jgi:hypothetical protein
MYLSLRSRIAGSILLHGRGDTDSYDTHTTLVSLCSLRFYLYLPYPTRFLAVSLYNFFFANDPFSISANTIPFICRQSSHLGLRVCVPSAGVVAR